MLSRRSLIASAAFSTLAGRSLAASPAGLRPGSPDDQSDALAKALERAAREGKAVFLEPGTYRIDGAVLPRGGANILGVKGRTRLVTSAPDAILRGDAEASYQLRDLTFEGAGPHPRDGAEALVSLANATMSMDGCTFENGPGDGLRLESCTGRVEGCHFKRIGRAGVHSNDGRMVLVQENVVERCGDAGLRIWRGEEGEDRSIVTQNMISHIGALSGGDGQNGNAINLFRAGGCIVSGNSIADCAFTAVRANAADTVSITDNNVRRCGETAIFVEFGWQGAVVSSNIVDDAATGISMTNFAEHDGRLGACKGNVLMNLRRTPPQGGTGGTGIAAEADTAIVGNAIQGAKSVGIRLGWGPYLRDVVATGNVVRDAPVGIGVSVVEGAGHVLVADNRVSGAERAVAAMRWDEIVSDDLTKTGGAGYPHITME